MPDDLDMQQYREVFLSESAEYVQAIVDGLLQLETDPIDLEPVEVVFRGAHSLKGMAAAMGYERTADLTHKMESLMDTVRRRVRPVDRDLIDLMLKAVDAVRLLIEDETTGRTDADCAAIVVDLVSCTEAAVSEAEPARGEEADGGVEVPAGGALMLVRVTLEPECVLKSVRAYMVIKRLTHMGQVVETHPSARDIEDEHFDRTFEVVVATAASPEDVARAARGVTEVEDVEVATAQEDATPASAEGPETSKSVEAVSRRAIPKLSETQTVRVSIGHLDTLVNLVGELVINRSRLENIAARERNPALSEALEELQRISSELQHEIMQTRMVPVGNIFNRFPRMARDLARDLGKDINFEMDGLDIELDRTVLDEIGDPLVHLLRNAIDHGLESTDMRKAAGKPPKGTVRLRATRERDQVEIAVSDDGRGMDPERIWEKACERGMVTADQRSEYSDEDILMLTCTPGFSTAETTTKVSGRGVGMDVVRGKIAHLGGSIRIRSEQGSGTELVMSLPLTLAIIQALLVRTAGQVFAIPLGSVAEVFSPEEVPIATVEGGPVVTLRDGRVASLYLLDVLVGASSEAGRLPQAGEQIVLMQMGEEVRALVVDSLVGRKEIVIKPLIRMLRQIRGLGGATVLGDGRVALILDPRLLFTMGREER